MDVNCEKHDYDMYQSDIVEYDCNYIITNIMFKEMHHNKTYHKVCTYTTISTI